jgi:hypothetical protein
MSQIVLREALGVERDRFMPPDPDFTWHVGDIHGWAVTFVFSRKSRLLCISFQNEDIKDRRDRRLELGRGGQSAARKRAEVA